MRTECIEVLSPVPGPCSESPEQDTHLGVEDRGGVFSAALPQTLPTALQDNQLLRSPLEVTKLLWDVVSMKGAVISCTSVTSYIFKRKIPDT